MKKESNLSKKVATVVATSLAVLGTVSAITTEKSDTADNNGKELVSNRQLKPQLVLNNALIADNGEAALQASHASHSSHSSHASHASHASSSI